MIVRKKDKRRKQEKGGDAIEMGDIAQKAVYDGDG